MTTEKTMSRRRLFAICLIGAALFIELLLFGFLPYLSPRERIFGYGPLSDIVYAITEIIFCAGILWLRSMSRHRALRMCFTLLCIRSAIFLVFLIFQISNRFIFQFDHDTGFPIAYSINSLSTFIFFILLVGAFARIRQELPRTDRLSLKIGKIQHIMAIQAILFYGNYFIFRIIANNSELIDRMRLTMAGQGISSLIASFCFALFLIQGLYALARDERFFSGNTDDVARPRIASASIVGMLCSFAMFILCGIIYAQYANLF